MCEYKVSLLLLLLTVYLHPYLIISEDIIQCAVTIVLRLFSGSRRLGNSDRKIKSQNDFSCGIFKRVYYLFNNITKIIQMCILLLPNVNLVTCIKLVRPYCIIILHKENREFRY